MSLTWFATTLQATVCSGNGDISGQYAFIANRPVFTGGLTGYPGLGSSTGTSGGLFPGETSRGLRGLIARAALGVPYDITGTIWADGSGSLYVLPGLNQAALGLENGSVSSLPAQIQIGTYQVNGDCTVSINFDTTNLENMLSALNGTSASGSGSGSGSGAAGSGGSGSGSNGGNGSGSTGGTGSTGATTGTGRTATFEGVLVERKNEIQLVQTDNVGGSRLDLVHTISTAGSCTNSSLTGSFGLVAKIGLLNASGNSGGPTGPASIHARMGYGPAQGGDGGGSGSGGSGSGSGGSGTGSGGTGSGGSGSNGGTGSGSNGGTGSNAGAASGFLNVNLYPVVGQLNADGNGNFVLLSNNSQSNGFNEITGTYTVNPDCTGTATLMVAPNPNMSATSGSGSSNSGSGSSGGATGSTSGSGNTTGTGTALPGQAGSTMTVEFVLGRELAPAPATGYLPIVEFVFTGTGISGGGTARPE